MSWRRYRVSVFHNLGFTGGQRYLSTRRQWPFIWMAKLDGFYMSIPWRRRFTGICKTQILVTESEYPHRRRT